ncbi:DUF4376 domain-containing protein [Mycoplana ramosa]|uniref:DUF4376 domain-containing protein n=1 Tax=Mycoplana ramosa TaxID=40837 RepID=A0ABW3YXE8_MYCRA
MRSAIIENGVVANVIVGSIEGSIPCADAISIGWSHDGEAFAPPEPEPVDLAAYAREKSWQVRVGGTTVNGAPIQTDGESIALITAMERLAERDPERVFEFDSLSGPITLTSTQAIAFSVAAGDWVQATFDRRAAVLRAIEAGHVTTTAEIDAAFVDVIMPWPS